MALSNELSSEIAAALLSSSNRSPSELKDLQEVVFRIHSMLQQLDDQGHSSRQKIKTEKRAAAGNG